MNTKTHYYYLEKKLSTYESLSIIIKLIPCVISFEDDFTIITAKENDFALIDDILALLS